jgi:uncharacterized SAM-binding protein YcdF (DUF218 family)
MGGLLLWIVGSVVLILAIVFYGVRDAAIPSAAIIILGAGVEADGTASQTLQVRAEQGAHLWQQGLAPIIICTGGVVGQAPRSEAEVCQAVLIAGGVPSSAIRLESSSSNTEENVRYARDLMQAEGLADAVVVSSRYHLLRARWLFWRAGVDVVMSPAPIGYLTPVEIAYSYFREWGAFHYQLLRDVFRLPHIYIPVP